MESSENSLLKNIFDLEDLDWAALTALNNEHAQETSTLSETEFRNLATIAFYARGIASGRGATGESVPAAFLIALDETASYPNPNFEYFQARHPRFVYIDRIITAGFARRLGLARRLYADLFTLAREAGHTVVGCEVNFDPPNPASDAFHASLGFVEAGRAQLKNGKTVRYLECILP